jgi:hypothetical protein
VSDLLQYVREVTFEKLKLVEEAIEECLNIGSNAPVVLQLTDSEIFHMAVHPNKGIYADDENDEGADKEEHISIAKCIRLTE